jgi:hypothetical protein
MKNYLIIILSLFFIFSFSCAKKKKHTAQPEGDIFISGSVKEPLEGKPIISAKVIVEDSSGKKLAETKTDEFGVFHTKLKKDDIKGDLKLKVEHQGYAPLSKVIRKDSIVRQISLELTPELVDSNFIIGRFIAGRYYKNEDGTDTMKTSSGQAMITVRFITGRMITGGTPSFISRIKSIFKKDEGGVSAEITVGDPDKNIGSFPGDFQASDPQFAKASGSSERVQLATSGWIDITFRDAEGNPVQVVSKDNPAIVMRRIPDSQQKDVIEAYKRGVRSIPWYYYDEGEGIWKRTEFDANVILVNEDVDGDGVQEEVAYAQVPITHTSYYNLDYPLNSTEICFQGKVLGANGKPVPGLYVIAYSSSSYVYTRTDDKGEFKIYVPQAKFRRCLEWGQECRWGNYFCWPSCIRYGNVLEYWRFKVFAADTVRWGEIQERTRVLDVSTEGKEKYKCHDIGVLPPPEMYSLSCSVKDVSGNPLVGASVVSSDGKAAETDSSGKFTLISKKGNLVLTVSYEKEGRIYRAQKEIYVDKDINEDVCSIVMRLEPVKIRCSAFINQNPGEIEVFVKGNSAKTNQDGAFEVSIPRPVKEEEVKLLYIAKFPDGSTEGQVQIIKVKPDDTEVLCPQNINFEYNEICVEGQVKNEEGKGIRGVYVLVGGKLPVIIDEDGFFKVQGGRAKKTEEGKYKYKVKYIYLGPYGREEVEKEYEAKGTECVWDKQEIDTRPAWLIGTVKTRRGRHIGGAKVETEFGEVDYTNPGGQFKLKAPTNSKVKVYASYGGATTQVEVQTKERGSTASVDIILNVEDTPPKVRVLGLGKAKPGGKLKFKIEITDDSDTVGYGVSIKDWGFSDSGTIKLESGRGEKEFEVVVPAGAKSADLEVEAKDTGGNEDKVVMKVEVVEKNRAPEIIRIDVEGEVMVGGRFIASAVGYDPEGDEMSYEWGLMMGERDYSGWMMVYGATAIVDVPENASGGTYLMKVKVKDSEGGERIFAREIKLTKEAKKGESVCVPSEEVCDGLDNDCNGLIDDGVKLVFYKDLDRDGYTDGTTSVGCLAPQGYVLSALLGDCNDENNQINPGKTEICDGIDNNCNGLIDEGVKLVFYKDSDGDGYTDGTTQVGCSAPSGYVLLATSGDCNDNDPNINPSKAEICDGKDNNCNGQIDEGVLLMFYRDKDGDGYGDVNDQTLACTQPTGYVSNSSDCNDNDPNANPGKTEICDGKDNNCNGQIDEGFNVGQSCTVGVGECARTGQYVCKADSSGTQCNATPGTPTTEICDGRDNDCDGQIDEGIVCHFAKTIGGGNDDGANSIIQSSDGGYAVAGWTSSFGAGYWDIYVVKLGSAGNVLWTKTIGGSKYEVANSIIQSSDGGYVVAGWTSSFVAGYYYDIYVVKLDSAGNVLWTKTIGGSYNDWANSIIQSSDGGYVVVGSTSSFGAGIGDIYVVKLDSAGNVLWTKTIGGSSDDFASSIIQSSDGGYVVAGETYSFGAGWDIYVVKLDSAGNVLWTKTIGGSYNDWANSIIQSSDGGYVVAGETESFGAGVTDIYVVKLDSAGNVLWTKTIGGSSDDFASSIIQSSDGGYVVAGATLSFVAGYYYDIYVVKLDSAGNVLWTKTIGGSSDDFASSIIQSSDGGYVVAGETYSFGAGIGDIYVVKMDANGNVCFSQNITNYSVSSTGGSFSSPSTTAFPQYPTVYPISPTISYGGSVSDVCASAPAPYLNICSASQDCGFGSAIATNREDVKSYGCSVGGVFSRFLIPASMLIVYGWLRKKRKKKKGF